MNKTLAAATLSSLVTVPAAAQTTAAAQTAPPAFNVYDGNNVLVGALMGRGLPDGSGDVVVARLTFAGLNNRGMPRHDHFLLLAKAGLSGNATFYFTQPNCVGQTLLPYDKESEVLPTAAFDGVSVIWGVAVATVSSYPYASKKPNGQPCINEQNRIEAAAAVPTINIFTPPFTVKP
jgi:hypothetical protein